LIERAKLQITLLQERRTALISAAVTGKIDVRHWQPPVVVSTPRRSVG
jgi:type I restriction enzyme S subunit